MSALKSFSFRKLLYNKKFTIPLSVFLSFALWIVITVESKPTSERTFSDMTVTINMENTFAAENGMSIVSDISSQRFTVLVVGPNNVVNSLSAKDINLYASAAEVDSPGEYNIEVLSPSTGVDYKVLNITPKTVKVNFDYMETREFTVEAVAEGAVAAEGLIAEVATVSGLESNTISITGPRTIINTISSVKAVATVDKTLSQSETFDATLILYNAKEKIIKSDNLQFNVDKVKIAVPISKRKTVPVKVDFSNTPNGFKKSGIKATVDHSEVAIIGTPDAVDKIEKITLSPIDLTTLSAKSQEVSVSAKLPEGIRLLDSIESFKVKIDLSNYAEDTITVTKVNYKGLGSGLKADKIEAIKNVKICGPKNVIKSLKASKAYAEVDLSDKKAGEHAVNAVISFDGYDSVWACGTYQTSVTIK